VGKASTELNGCGAGVVQLLIPFSELLLLTSDDLAVAELRIVSGRSYSFRNEPGEASLPST